MASIQTLEPKQPWQLSTRTNSLLPDTHALWKHASVCCYVCVWSRHARLVFYMCVFYCLCESLHFSFTVLALPIHSSGKHPGVSRQHSGEPTPCQKQFGTSPEISSCWGAVMEGKSKTPTWLAGLPASWKENLATWPDFAYFTENHRRRWSSCLLLCNME